MFKIEIDGRPVQPEELQTLEARLRTARSLRALYGDREVPGLERVAPGRTLGELIAELEAELRERDAGSTVS